MTLPSPLPMSRVAYVDVSGTGRVMTLHTQEGSIEFDRIDPHGVQIVIGGQAYGVTKDALPYIGRFFLAAAVMLGVDLNEGWDKPIQEGGAGRAFW